MLCRRASLLGFDSSHQSRLMPISSGSGHWSRFTSIFNGGGPRSKLLPISRIRSNLYQPVDACLCVCLCVHVYMCMRLCACRCVYTQLIFLWYSFTSFTDFRSLAEPRPNFCFIDIFILQDSELAELRATIEALKQQSGISLSADSSFSPSSIRRQSSNISGKEPITPGKCHLSLTDPVN